MVLTVRFVVIMSSAVACGQDLAPRAYLVTPSSLSAVTLSNSFSSGSVFLDPTIPIENFKGSFDVQLVSYYYSFGLFGRSANITAFLPYAVGTFQGTVSGVPEQAYRSGLADGRIRFAVNLHGGRAMSAREYSAWHEKTTVGASLTVSIPSGQYDPGRLINAGDNRWAFKSEVGASHRWGKWMLDCYGGVWIFGANNSFYPGSSVRTQEPVPDAEVHFGYYVKPRLWASFDANFWTGGRSTINGVTLPDEERNSRVGATISIPAGRHQSLKLSYSTGAYVTIGGNYRTVAVAWQYSWLGNAE